MSRSSDLGRLWFRRGVAGFNPIENFTTEALAIAITHDATPLRKALKRAKWPGEQPMDFDQVVGARASVQKYLPEVNGIRSGYLDLVLDLQLKEGRERVTWVEVKVDSPEGRAYKDPKDFQLNTYEAHARHRAPDGINRPVILTLSKEPLRPLDETANDFPIGWLSWDDLALAIEESPRANGRWGDLRKFLAEYGIAPWPKPSGLPEIDPSELVPVLWKVNEELRKRYPNTSLSWRAPRPALLTAGALSQFAANYELTTTGGPLTYGLAPVDGTWAWLIRIGTENAQRVPLEAGALIRRADEAGLAGAWGRGTTLRSVLEISTRAGKSLDQGRAHEWFCQVLDEIEAKDLLRDYLDGLKSTAWTRLLERASHLELGHDVESLVAAVRGEGLYVSARHQVVNDSSWALVAPDVRGHRSTALMYFIPEPGPEDDPPRIRVDRARGSVEALLGLDEDSQEALYGPKTQLIQPGEAARFCEQVLKPFAAAVRNRLS